MKTFWKTAIPGLALILVLGSATGWAQEKDDRSGEAAAVIQAWDDDFSPGFNGYIQPLTGVAWGKSLSEVSDANERIESLDQDAKSETQFSAMVLWNLSYTLDNASTKFFAGTPEENILEGTFFLEAGISQKLPGGTVLTAAYIPQLPGLDDEVWQDPFLLGANRQKTDRDAQAFRFSADSLFGTPITIRYGFGKQDIENDNAGRYHSLLPGSTLTARDLQALKRSGTFHQADLLYGFELGNDIFAQPGLYYMKGNADGDANSFDRFGAQVLLSRTIGRYHLFCTLSAQQSGYDAVHPIFNETRKEWEYNAVAGIGYAAPFGWENFMANLYTGYTRKDANIGFYDTSGLMAGIGLTWMF